MSTNDPQVEYKREPLLSDSEKESLCDYVTGRDGWNEGAKAVRDFYEAKITSGELRVVKTFKFNPYFKDTEARTLCGRFDICPYCDHGMLHSTFNHCPGCGAKIIKE